MAKKKYYVSVQAKTICEHQDDATYELEIYANEDDVERLERIFDTMERFDNAAGLQEAFIIPITHLNMENVDNYEHHLKEAYSLIRELGTQETKQHIREMGLF